MRNTKEKEKEEKEKFLKGNLKGKKKRKNSLENQNDGLFHDGLYDKTDSYE